jgi:type IV pilus assembly protein PilP
MKRKNRALAALLLLLLALPVACKKEEKAAPPPETKKSEPPKPAQPSPKVQSQASSAKQPARIDFSRKTDPFKAYAPAVAAPTPVAPQAAPVRTGDQLPIQSFDVARFKLVGIIAGINQNRALVIDPTGKGYVVQEGMEIGINQGHITRITASSVEVIESFKADNGRIKKRKVVLTLAKKR